MKELQDPSIDYRHNDPESKRPTPPGQPRPTEQDQSQRGRTTPLTPWTAPTTFPTSSRTPLSLFSTSTTTPPLLDPTISASSTAENNEVSKSHCGERWVWAWVWAWETSWGTKLGEPGAGRGPGDGRGSERDGEGEAEEGAAGAIMFSRAS